MKTKEQTGFTIVEVLIGMIAAAVLALAAGTMLASTYRGWFRSLAVADMERDAALAIHTLDLAVRFASNTVSGGVGVDILKVAIPSNGIVRAFSTTGVSPRKSLWYYRNWNNEPASKMAVVTNRLDSFHTTVTAGVVRVTMTLSGIDQNNEDTGVRMGITNMCIRMRNFKP